MEFLVDFSVFGGEGNEDIIRSVEINKHSKESLLPHVITDWPPWLPAACLFVVTLALKRLTFSA